MWEGVDGADSGIGMNIEINNFQVKLIHFELELDRETLQCTDGMKHICGKVLIDGADSGIGISDASCCQERG